MISMRGRIFHLKDFAKAFIMQKKFNRGFFLQNLKVFNKQGFYATVKVWLMSEKKPKSQKFFVLQVAWYPK